MTTGRQEQETAFRPEVVLFEPEIPQNTGNIARTCAVLGCPLHLIEPLGFSLRDRYLRRAGLDYWHLVKVKRYANLEAFFSAVSGNPAVGEQKPQGKEKNRGTAPECLQNPIASPGSGVSAGTQKNFFFFTKKGERSYHEACFRGRVYLFFGQETGGLPADLLARFPDCRYRIPMRPGARSLNLSNAAAVVLYEAFRQNGFPGLITGK